MTQSPEHPPGFPRTELNHSGNFLFKETELELIKTATSGDQNEAAGSH